MQGQSVCTRQSRPAWAARGEWQQRRRRRRTKEQWQWLCRQTARFVALLLRGCSFVDAAVLKDRTAAEEEVRAGAVLPRKDEPRFGR